MVGKIVIKVNEDINLLGILYFLKLLDQLEIKCVCA